MAKRKLCVMVDEELYRELIVIAPRVHGKSMGALSALVERALREHLEKLKEIIREGELRG